MIALFALVCTLEAPEICREVMLPASAPLTESCGQAARDFAADWARDHPDALLVHNVACREAAALPLDEIAPGVYVHVGEIAQADPENLNDTSNIAFVVGERSVAAIDSGGSRAVGERALAALRGVTDKPLSHLFVSHMHPDHVYGASVFVEAGATVVAHPGLAAALAARAGIYRETMIDEVGAVGFLGSLVPQVDVAVEAPQAFDLGGRVLRAVPQDTAHTDNDLVVIDAATGTLFAGDLVFSDHIPTLDGSLRGWQRALDGLARMEATRVVPGHGPVVGFPEGLGPTATYLDALARDTAAAIDAGASLTDAAPRIARDQAAEWRLFEQYHIRNATSAYAELEWE